MSEINRQYLKQLFEDVQIQTTPQQLSYFAQYADFLLQENEKMNLTAIIQSDEVCVKHFLDSVSLLSFLPKESISLIDVGTGAGFPSVPCKIIRPELQLTMLDSLQKRVRFLQQLSDQLGQENQCIHARAEEAGKLPDLREQFTVATARAVAHLRELAEYCLPFVKLGGMFIALKGWDIEGELEEAKPAIARLGGQIEQVEQYSLPMNQKRSIVVIKKISQTPTKYPRNPAKIKKQPIK